MSLKIIKTLNLNNHQEVNLAEIVKTNIKKITLLPTKNIIKPIYISDNKILSWTIVVAKIIFTSMELIYWTDSG